MTNESATPGSERIGFVPEWKPWDGTASCGSRIYKAGCEGLRHHTSFPTTTTSQ